MAPREPEPNPAQPQAWTRHLRGHLLQFDRHPEPNLSPRAGLLLLLAAVSVELLRLIAVKGFGPGVPLWLLLPALLVVALLAAPVIAQVRWPQLGLRAWRDWTVTEKLNCVHVLVMAVTFFLLLLTSSKGLPSSLGTVFLPYLCYGFYQELVYRGMLQTALVRRGGALIGILVANALYTFGPLHWNHYFTPVARAVPMFASIFAIGLFFGVLYRRSGNLWLVAIFHGIGNACIIWSTQG